MADKEEEFEIVNEEDAVVGRAPRSRAHAEGLLHRAVYCWVFDTAGKVLIQKRSAEKKIGPSQWDLSVAEHLQPGETYREAACRGLKEELGICVLGSALEGPLAPTHRRDLRVGPIHDAELVQSYSLRGYEGQVMPDPVEVAAVKFENLSTVEEGIRLRPDNFTQWIRAEGSMLHWFREGEL